MIIAAILVSLFMAWIITKDKPNIKIGSDKRYQISKREYKIFCENSDKAIVNTTVSFGPELCSDKNEIDDMYSRTVIVGNRFLRQEGFKISIVGRI